MKLLFDACVLVSLAGILSGGCVVSTGGGPGTPPDVPLPPKEEISDPNQPEGGLIQIGARHILISYQGAMRAAPYVTRTKDEAQTFAETLRGRAESGEDFAELAMDHSDDRGSAASGGELGTFRRDQMVPEFSQAAFRLEVGEISQVVESPFGFHVIQRTE